MDQQAMLTRDLVLRICATATEFDLDWIEFDRKIVAPFTAARDTSLIERITAAAAAVGVDHVLICRTRSEYAYEPVIQVRAATSSLIGVIRSWGDTPTDFLVCLEDLSAAVLVTADELTVAAGPADYVAAFVGDDIGRARAEFAETAHTRNDPELLQAAVRYGCLDPAGRDKRKPRGDVGERVSAWGEALRDRSPRSVARARAVRGAWGWIALLLLALAALVVPAIPTALTAVALTVWLLAQLAWLARSRTLSFAALLRLTVLGALALGPIAFLELAVAAAACGAGFQLAETGATVLSADETAFHPLPQGGAFTLFPGWLEIPWADIRFSGHAVTTGLVGATLGIAVVGRRLYGAKLWLLPPLALGAAALEHLTFNALLAGLEPTALTATVFALYGNGAATRWLLLLFLVCGVLLDYRMQRLAAHTTPPLPGKAPLRRLAAQAYGRAVWYRSHLPGDIAPLFRRIALAWARLPVTLVEAAAAILHEYTVQLAAASRGPTALCTGWRVLRRRREHAMGVARAAGQPTRVPDRDKLAAEADGLLVRLRLATPAALAVCAAAAAVVDSLDPGVLGGAYALPTLLAVTAWFTALPTADAVWVLVGAGALVSLLASGWSVPRDQPNPRRFLRTPRATIGAVLGAAAPGQLPYAAVGMLGLLLPKSTARLLVRSR